MPPFRLIAATQRAWYLRAAYICDYFMIYDAIDYSRERGELIDDWLIIFLYAEREKSERKEREIRWKSATRERDTSDYACLLIYESAEPAEPMRFDADDYFAMMVTIYEPRCEREREPFDAREHWWWAPMFMMLPRLFWEMRAERVFERERDILIDVTMLMREITMIYTWKHTSSKIHDTWKIDTLSHLWCESFEQKERGVYFIFADIAAPFIRGDTLIYFIRHYYLRRCLQKRYIFLQITFVDLFMSRHMPADDMLKDARDDLPI
jgi:hypothetical protein